MNDFTRTEILRLMVCVAKTHRWLGVEGKSDELTALETLLDKLIVLRGPAE